MLCLIPWAYPWASHAFKDRHHGPPIPTATSSTITTRCSFAVHRVLAARTGLASAAEGTLRALRAEALRWSGTQQRAQLLTDLTAAAASFEGCENHHQLSLIIFKPGIDSYQLLLHSTFNPSIDSSVYVHK